MSDRREKYKWFEDMLIKAFGERSDFGFDYKTTDCGREFSVNVWFSDTKIHTGLILERISPNKSLLCDREDKKVVAEKFIAGLKKMIA